MQNKLILDKSIAFSIRIINLSKYLSDKKKEFIISKQIIRSGTSIGANISEAYCASSKKDFISKFYISFKEANETLYWLILLKETKYITHVQYKSLNDECNELIKLISSTIKTSKNGC